MKFSTPLSSIRESVNMIIEEVFGPINDKQRKFLSIASVEIQRINKLLNYLLNVSVLESDVRKKKSVRLNTRELVLSSTEIFASFAEKKKVTLRLVVIRRIVLICMEFAKSCSRYSSISSVTRSSIPRKRAR